MLNLPGLDLDPGTLKRYSALALLIALLLWESLAPFQHFFVGRTRQRIVHGARNLGLSVLNALCTAAILATLWTWAVAWATRHDFGILNWLDLQSAWRWVVAIVSFDAWMYGWHRANHRLGWLWRLHRVHHCDPYMDVTTAQRFHLGEILLSSLLRVPVLILLGLNLTELVIYETLMFGVVQLHHANIALPPLLDHCLRSCVVTPALHKVHHSRIRTQTDSNYGSLFSWWDRVFGSWCMRTDLEAIEFGLDGFDSPAQQRFAGLMLLPRE